MKTSCFKNYQGPGRISIARYAPRGTPSGYKVVKALAPGAWFNSVSQFEYRQRYFAQLEALDPEATWNELHRLARMTSGRDAEPVLLCWEKPPFTSKNWCHRRMVAEWFQRTLGREVPELETGQLSLL
ncbi:MAG: DUF488 family protein [Polyangiaceae bacterium]